MEQSQLNWIVGYIWGIADDVLRDLYVRGKYRDVILPMTVLRRFDAVLENTKQGVLDMKETLDKAGIVEQDQALRQASGQAIYNTSPFTMNDLKARSNRQQLKVDFENYLDGFSPNVHDILDNFEFRNQLNRLSKADALRNPLLGYFAMEIEGKPVVVEYGPDTELRDTEQVSLNEKGGIEAFLQREVLPYAPDAWYVESSVKIGYEISFTRHFYKTESMRSLDEIRSDILAVEKETEGLLEEILGR